MGRGWPKAGTSWGSKRAWGAQGAWGTHRTWWSQGSWGAHTSKAARGSGLLPGNCWGTRLHLRSQGASVGRGRKVETGIYVVSIIHLIGVGTNLLRTGNFAISVLFTVSCCSALKDHNNQFEFSWISTCSKICLMRSWSGSSDEPSADFMIGFHENIDDSWRIFHYSFSNASSLLLPKLVLFC